MVYFRVQEHRCKSENSLLDQTPLYRMWEYDCSQFAMVMTYLHKSEGAIVVHNQLEQNKHHDENFPHRMAASTANRFVL